MSAPGKRCWMILPSRSATSRHKSFSIKPVGPIVPVSWPPWPGSMTIRPIFKPNARVKVDWPSRVGWGAEAGWTKSGFIPDDALMDFDRAFLELGLEVVVVDAELLPATEPLMALFVFDAGCSEKGDEFVEPLEATVC